MVNLPWCMASGHPPTHPPLLGQHQTGFRLLDLPGVRHLSQLSPVAVHLSGAAEPRCGTGPGRRRSTGTGNARGGSPMATPGCGFFPGLLLGIHRGYRGFKLPDGGYDPCCIPVTTPNHPPTMTNPRSPNHPPAIMINHYHSEPSPSCVVIGHD